MMRLSKRETAAAWHRSASRCRSLVTCAPVAQLDRAPGFEPVGRGFKSLRAHHPISEPIPEIYVLTQVSSTSVLPTAAMVAAALRATRTRRTESTFRIWHNVRSAREGLFVDGSEDIDSSRFRR
jgi:hypothetical protein